VRVTKTARFDIFRTNINGKLHFNNNAPGYSNSFSSLERTPELWSKLERDAITLREACGNACRNITASAIAGIDPEEPLTFLPYALSLYFF